MKNGLFDKNVGGLMLRESLKNVADQRNLSAESLSMLRSSLDLGEVLDMDVYSRSLL